MDRPSARRQHQHAQASSSVDVVTSPTSATSTSLSDILATKRSSWPRIILHPSTGSVDWPPPSSNHPARRSSSRHGRATSRSSRRARSSSPFNGRSVDDGWVVKTCATAADLNSAATATSPVDGATVVRCLDSCDKILLRHSTTITWPHVTAWRHQSRAVLMLRDSAHHVTDDVLSCHFRLVPRIESRFPSSSSPATAKWKHASPPAVQTLFTGWRRQRWRFGVKWSDVSRSSGWCDWLKKSNECRQENGDLLLLWHDLFVTFYCYDVLW